MNKKTLIGIAVAAASLIAGPAKAEEIVLKVAHFWPATALSQQKIPEPWCAKIAAESNNRLGARSSPPCSSAARRRS